MINPKKHLRNKGQAAILIVFILGMVTLLISLSLVKTGFNESLQGRGSADSLKAFYLANSGVEDAIYRVQTGVSLAPYTLTIDSGDAKVEITDKDPSGDIKEIKSQGTSGSYTRRIITVIAKSTTVPGFIHAIHAGQGGFELENTTSIAAIGSGVGNVFSNSSIFGAKNSCGNSGSKISGSAWAVNKITKLSAGGSDGVCIGQNGHANTLEYCNIGGTPYSPNSMSINCSSPNPRIPEPAITPIPLPDLKIPALRDYVKNKQIFNGNCTIGQTSGCYTIVNGVATIGDIYISGDLIKPNSVNLNISGPVYVQGNVNFGSNSTIGLSQNINGGVSPILATAGTIISSSNITYETRTTPLGQKMFLIFVSDKDAPGGDSCASPAITLSSNANSVLFYATKGCVLVNSNSTFLGSIIGEKVRVENNSVVKYDPELATAIFGLTSGGGWITTAFSEY